MISNKKLGNSFETELCEKLSKYGFWSHNFMASKSGQPADIIAVRNERAYLIDCKVCSNKYFKFGRMEENQINAMTLWEHCGNTKGLFVLKIDCEIWVISKSICMFLNKTKKQINLNDIHRYGQLFDVWVESV